MITKIIEMLHQHSKFFAKVIVFLKKQWFFFKIQS